MRSGRLALGLVVVGRLWLRLRSRLRARVTGELLVSGTDPLLTRALLTLRARRSGPLRIEHCPD